MSGPRLAAAVGHTNRLKHRRRLPGIGWGNGPRAAPLQDDDAYFVGIDYKTGLHVVIGEQQASKGRVQIRDDRKVIFMTPDELATLVAGIQIIAEAKTVFPDAEVIQLYPEYGSAA